MSTKTTQSIKITPAWSNCYTTSDPEKVNIPIHVNGCFFEFTSGKTGKAHHTAHFICPVKPLEITHPNCTIKVPTQTTEGTSTTNITHLGKQAVTLTSTAKVTSHYESGICIFLGTSQTTEMKGSVTVEAKDTAGNPVNLTSTTGA